MAVKTKSEAHKLPRQGLKKQFKLLPGHIIVGVWCLFTLIMLLWIVCASLSTSPEIMRGNAMKFQSGVHFENYLRAWTANNISAFFLNSTRFLAKLSILPSSFLTMLFCSFTTRRLFDESILLPPSMPLLKARRPGLFIARW